MSSAFDPQVPTAEPPSIVEILRSDYQRFPQDQTYSIYAEDVWFEDPLNRFRGIDRYRQMIGFIAHWFREPQLELHHIEQHDRHLRTEWTLRWIAPFPWQPRLAIPGHSEMELNEAGLIQSHIDYWHCSPWSVLRQAFPFGGES